MDVSHGQYTANILGIKWQDRVPDTEVLEKAGLPSIYTVLAQTQLRWAGHVARMEDHRLPKQLLFGELTEGKQMPLAQKGVSKTPSNLASKAFDLQTSSWELTARDRTSWRKRL